MSVKPLSNQSTFGKKYNFYRKNKFTINFQTVLSQNAFNTLNVEIAPINNDKVGWKDKISLQLSESDLFKVFWLIQHNKPIVFESKYHGSSNNKSVKFVENDEGGCQVGLNDGAAKKSYFFTCSAGEWYYAKLLFCEQMLGHGLSMSEAKLLLPKPKDKTK
jgi:hypothetical protein